MKHINLLYLPFIIKGCLRFLILDVSYVIHYNIIIYRKTSLFGNFFNTASILEYTFMTLNVSLESHPSWSLVTYLRTRQCKFWH